MKSKIEKYIATLLCFSLLCPIIPASAVKSNDQDNAEEIIEAVALTKGNVPEIISPDTIQENQHIARIFSEESDLNTIVFLNSDDTATLYYFEDAVKFIDADGEIRDKSNQLYSTFDTPKFSEEFAYFNKNNDIQTFFPKKLSEISGILLRTEQREISLYPLGVNAGDAIKVDSDTGDKVLYPDVFGLGTSIEYAPTFRGFKEEILLSNDGCNTFNFILNPGEFEPICLENRIVLKSYTDETQVAMDPIYVYDSYVGDYVNDIDTYCHNTWNNTVGLQALDNGLFKITITVDQNFLSDPRTKYPVHVDPSFTVNTSGSGSTKTIQDLPLYNGTGARGLACGSNPYNLIGYAGMVGNKEYGVGRLLMKFPGLLNNSTYKALGENSILNATLSIKEGSGLSNRATIYAYQYTGSTWYESSTTYSSAYWDANTSPSTYATVGSSSQTTLSLDITKIVKGWKNNSSYAEKGILLKNSNESSTSYRKDLLSTESSNKPSLSINYVFYGCKPYVVQNSQNINCHGYATFVNTWPRFFSEDDVTYCKLNPNTTTAQALARTKTRMTTWLNNNFRGRWKEVSSDNVTLADNQWLIVMRIGKHGTEFDYHYWYRTNNGPWANKHGSYPSVLLPASHRPTTNYSSGWAYGNQQNFYNSAIVYYVLTE